MPTENATLLRDVARRMTLNDFLRLPDDGVDRELVNGLVWTYSEREMASRRVPLHCRTTAKVSGELSNWSRNRPEPRGEVLSGHVGVHLAAGKGTAVGIDAIYLSANALDVMRDDAEYVEVAPTLAVEVLAPLDTVWRIYRKNKVLLAAGVEAVWCLNPYDRVLAIYRRNEPVRVFNETQRVEDEPYLPGFAVDVAAFFGR